MIFVSCAEGIDLLKILRDNGIPVERFDTPREALAHAPDGSAVMLLADDSEGPPAPLEAALLEDARARRLRLYVEYGAPPVYPVGSPTTPEWERVVVASDAFGEALPAGRILSLSGCPYAPTTAKRPWLVIARVAGYDTAVFGVPAGAAPILFEPEDGAMLVATAALSAFRAARFGPAAEWRTVWQRILAWLDPDAPPVALSVEPRVRPAYGPEAALPENAERRAIWLCADWVHNARILPTPERYEWLSARLLEGVEAGPPPPEGAPSGDGSHGVQEGYASGIRCDGSQWQRLPIRADCQAETAMVLAMNAEVRGSERDRETAANLLKFLYETSGLCGGARGNPEHPAFGHISWGTISPVWEVANYGDDNARALMGTMLTTAALGTDAWDAAMLRALLANLRTTGRQGFRGSRIDMPDLERKGWRAYAEADLLNFAPHYEAFMWACYLWAYRHTGHAPFLETAKRGIRAMMGAYPDRWTLQDNSERGQMLLPLAWLMRLEPTDEVRAWLRRIADDLLATQQPCGAIPERMEGRGDDVYMFPASNEEYGVTETPLIQENGDPASDQLYTAGFALLGLHEAAAVTGDADLRAAEDRLAEYLCRIQVHAEGMPDLHGAWFRAFDFRRWDYWASSADAGWGAWCIESGWGQAWIAAVLALRQTATNLWDRTAQSRIGDQMERVQAEMARNTGEPWPSNSA